jgi:chromosome segregation ATPase
MKKMLIVGMIGAVALFVIAKKTNVFSYGSTLISQVATDAKNQVPTKFELDRIRNEIAALDGDISQMIRPVAEYKADIVWLRKDIEKTSAKLEEKKQLLLAVVAKLEGCGKATEIKWNGKMCSVERVEQELRRQTESVKLLEKNVKAQQQMLEAKETSLKATQEQLAKIVAMKREFEVRLTELEAMDQSLQVQRIASDIKIDQSRPTHIKDSLEAMHKRLDADRIELETRKGEFANIDLFEPQPEPVDLGTIRGYLEGNEAPAKVANNK